MPGVSEAFDPDIRASVRKGQRRAILPVGSLEQHGPHLPLATDAILAEEIAKRISGHVDALVLPCVPYGISSEHKPLFNVSLRSETFAAMISDICASLAENGIRRIVLLNGHYGNEATLSSVAQMIAERMPRDTLVYSLSYWFVLEDGIGHADEIETSLMLAVRPDLVSMKNARRGSARIPGRKKQQQIVLSKLTALPASFPKITASGVLGDPRKASGKKGRTMLDQISRRLADVILDVEKSYASLFKRK